MDRKLQLIAHLYREELDELEPLADLLEDAELRDEYDALGNTQGLLENLAPSRPGPAVVDSILEAATQPVRLDRSADRGPLRRVTLRRIWIPALSAAAVVALFAVSLWPTLSLNDHASAPAATESMGEMESGDRTLRDMDSPAPTMIAQGDQAAKRSGNVETPSESLLSEPIQAALAAAAPPAGRSDLAWDTGDDVRQLFRRIEALKAAGVDGWDEPAVPLELLPAGPADSRVRQVGGNPPRNHP